MKTLKPGSKILNVIGVIAIIGIFCGTTYGIALAGQQNPHGSTLAIALNGAFWSFFYSLGFFGAIIYPTFSVMAHLVWCLFTHDRKYHWLIRTITGAIIQFKELQPKYYEWI